MSHRLDAAIAQLEWLVREDFAERRLTRSPRGWWGYDEFWHAYLVEERAALRSYIAALRVLRRERDDDMEDARLTADAFLSRGQSLSPETAAQWTRTQRREARMWVTGALSRAPRHVAPADLGGNRGE